MGSTNPLILKSGETGSVFTNAPVMSPKYQLPGAGQRYETMARLGVTSIPPFAVFGGNFERYKQALTGNGYIDFLLQSAVENFQEIVQVDELLGDTYVPWVYGQHAPTFTYSGVLLNTRQDQWRSAMHYLYNDVFRGTRLGKNHMLVRLQYDTFLVEGAMVSFVQSMNANDETMVQFNFQILVKRFLDLSPPAVSSLPVTVSRPFESVLFAPTVAALEAEANASTLALNTTSIPTTSFSNPTESTLPSTLSILNGFPA
jgi:hypothetical protein